MATQIKANIGQGNGMLPDGTKPLTETILNNHYPGPVGFSWGSLTANA